jgi:quercetin dioxygenase-like cupin family protein
VETRIIRGKDVEIQEKEWGTLQWSIGGKDFKDVNMTFGIVTIRPGQANPLHTHPNCEEVLHVLKGSVEHTLPEGGTTRLETGDTIVLKRGKGHQARNTGKENAVVAVVFNNWDRKVENE